MKNTLAVVGIVPLMACAATGVARPATEVARPGAEVARHVDEPPLRGAIHTTGRSVRALRAGPAVIHAYSGFRGGGIYVVPVVEGTDADCAAQKPAGGSTGPAPLEADRRMTVHVAAGALACLATDTPRRF